MMKSVLMVLAVVVGQNVASAQVQIRITVPEVRVRVAPPPPRVEVQPQRQSPDQIWIAGHWARRGNSNVWIPGVWTVPPQDGMVWEKERWYQRDGAWFYAEGHWRWERPTTPTAVYDPPPVREQIVVEHRPPPNIAERRPPAPFRRAVWIPGYWRWDPQGSQHNWVAGHWSARRGDDWVWTPDRWRREPARGKGHGHGNKARWVLVPGHWNRR